MEYELRRRVEHVYDSCMSSGVDTLDATGGLDHIEFTLTPDELLHALAAHERETARLALAVRSIEQRRDWAADGSVSMAAWLRTHARMSAGDANRWVRLGRFLDRFPTVADAAVVHRLSLSQLNVLRQACPERLEVILADMQTEIVDTLAPLDIADTHTACAVWRQRADALIDGPEPAVVDRELVTTFAADGTLAGRFVLDPAAAVQFEQAIRNAVTWEGDQDLRNHRQRAVDALGDICSFYNKNHQKPGTPRRHPHIGLSMDASTIENRPEAIDTNGRLIAHYLADAALCDCVIHRVMRSGTVPTSVGHTTRTVPAGLFRQVAARDGGCRFPGCTRPIRYTDAHHIHYWHHLGPTEYENLVLLCSRHHHHVHRRHLHLKLLPNGELHTTWPDGTTRITQPRGAPPTRAP
jgi:hypothetical protein